MEGVEAVPVSNGPALVVVWADPGRHTGWSVHRVSISSLLTRGQVGSTSLLWWRIGQFDSTSTSSAVDSYLALCRTVWERSRDSDVVVVGCEGFTLMMNSKDYWLLEPVRFLAVLQDRLRGTEVRVEVQGAGDAKKTITNERLATWGLYEAGKEHGRDAQRHGLLYLRRFASQLETRRRAGWLAG
jgi:hypothetical protein